MTSELEKTGVKMDFITVHGREIFRADVISIPDDFAGMLEHAGNIIRSRPPGSVLCLTIAHDWVPIFTNRDIFIDYLKKNRPYIRATALYGLAQPLVHLLNSVINLAGRDNIRLFHGEKEAVDWLVAQQTLKNN